MRLHDRIARFFTLGSDPVVDTTAYDEARRRIDREIVEYKVSREPLLRKLSTAPGETERAFFPSSQEGIETT